MSKLGTAADMALGGPSSHSISIRPIENGHIVSHTASDGDGYKHREYFSAKPPRIQIRGLRSAPSVSPESRHALRDAVDELHASRVKVKGSR